jgi:transposase
MNQKRQRQKFTKQFKEDAVKLVLENRYSCSEVGRRLGINQTNVSRWVSEHRDRQQSYEAGEVPRSDLERENKRLRKENERLRMEREILKKAAAFFAKESN